MSSQCAVVRSRDRIEALCQILFGKSKWIVQRRPNGRRCLISSMTPTSIRRGRMARFAGEEKISATWS